MALKQRRVLIVREPFASYTRGALISDPDTMATIEAGPNQHHVYASMHDIDDEPAVDESPKPADDAQHSA